MTGMWRWCAVGTVVTAIAVSATLFAQTPPPAAGATRALSEEEKVEGAAVLDLIDDVSQYQIPLGSSGEAAIYTHHFHHVSLLRKILLRMRSWQNYVYMEGH